MSEVAALLMRPIVIHFAGWSKHSCTRATQHKNHYRHGPLSLDKEGGVFMKPPLWANKARTP